MPGPDDMSREERLDKKCDEAIDKLERDDREAQIRDLKRRILANEDPPMTKLAEEDLRRGPDAEPEPTPGEAEVTPLVIADLQSRSDFGARKYGTRLQTFNGRDALKDAYQEALDLCCYLRQRIEEEERLEQKVIELEALVEELRDKHEGWK